MAQNIQLQQVVVYRMVIEMGRCNSVVHIIGRVLHRCKLIDAVSVRKYNDSSRMLSRTSADSRTPFCNTVNLTFSFTLTMFFVIVFHKSVGSLVRQRSDRSGFECMSLTKQVLLYIYELLPDNLPRSSGQYPALYFPLNPRKVSNGISNPALTSFSPHFGHIYGPAYPIRSLLQKPVPPPTRNHCNDISSQQ